MTVGKHSLRAGDSIPKPSWTRPLKME